MVDIWTTFSEQLSKERANYRAYTKLEGCYVTGVLTTLEPLSVGKASGGISAHLKNARIKHRDGTVEEVMGTLSLSVTTLWKGDDGKIKVNVGDTIGIAVRGILTTKSSGMEYRDLSVITLPAAPPRPVDGDNSSEQLPF